MTKIEAARREYADWCDAVGITRMSDVTEILDRVFPLSRLSLTE